MKKFTKFIATATAALLALGFAGCEKNSDGSVSYPNFINPTEISGGHEVSEKYVVNVLSEGGLKLDNVKVTARKGDIIKRGISDGGKIEFALALGEYELEIDPDSLPEGYYLPNGVTYKTNGTKREEVTIRIPSKLIDASAAVSSYAVGSIMRDFRFTDCDGTVHTLSELLKTKKAVVLNFFYTGCGPCRSEFPAIQRAYQNRPNSDVEILAMSTANNGDDDSTVAKFKSQNGLTFPMGIDRLGLTNQFVSTGFPTTVVIDRYGLIAYRTSGGEPTTQFWSNMFAKYAANDYVQDVSSASGGNGNVPVEIVKPDKIMPPSSEMKSAAVETNTAASESEIIFTPEDHEYSWPWLAEPTVDGGYIYSSNKGVGNSYAIVNISIQMRKDQVLSFDYKISSEAGNDLLYVMLDGDPMNTGWSGDHKDTWNHVDLYVADYDKTVELSFTYLKDPADADDGSSGDDVAKIRNISLSDKSVLDEASPLDVMRNCASGGNDGYYYDHYVDYEYYDPDLYSGGDGFYHIVLEREEPVGDETKGAVKTWGPIIYMTLSQLTPWSDLHTGSTLTAANGTQYSATLFKMTEQQYVNTDGKVTAVIGGKDVTEAYTVYVLIMPYMQAPFYLIPVTPLLKSWADAFVADFEKGKQHDNEWLEFCYYYDHYGVEHSDETLGDGEVCKVDEDYTRGLTTLNAYTAYEKSELENMTAEEKAALDTNSYNKDTGRNRALINFPLQLTHNGTYYKFKATKKGVYKIRSYTTGCSPDSENDDGNSDYSSADPALQIYDKNNNPLMISGEPADFDALRGVDYEGFNEYITLEAGEEIYLYLETTLSTRSYYDFEIEYMGETYEKLFVCSPGGGIWTYREGDNGKIYWIYSAVPVRYDDVSDCYYVLKNGQIDYDQPVYINMLYASYLVCELPQYYFQSLKYMIEDKAFDDYLRHGDEYQPVMESYLGQSTDGKNESDWDYGLVKANKEIVDILNMFITQNVDSVDGQTTGWLAFGAYVAQLG